jgi:sugar phosphate isomerase/epimerase
MANLKIGVFIDNMGLPLEPALDKAVELGADGFQIYVIKGPMLAENQSAEQRKAFRRMYHSRGLTLSATCCDFSIGLDKPEAEAILPKLMAAVDQALDLGTDIITTHIGHVPEDLDPKVCDPMRKRLEKVAKYAESKGVTFATETGPESGATLAALLSSVDSAGIGANFDPANLVMGGFDHMQSARDLADFIVHAHAKDGKRKGGEVPLGEGDVNFPEYIAMMEEIGFECFHTIEREAGPDPLGDIEKAVAFLRGL